MKHLFVIDLMNIAFRGFYAHPDLKTSTGIPTGMCYGVVKILDRILSEYSPDYVVVATDAPGKTFRHAMYPLYKSNRNTKPLEFSEQMGTLYRIIAAYGFPLLEVDQMEADDLIGSVARQLSSDELCVTIVSGDKDFMQLINKNVRLLRVTNDGDFFCDEQGVMARFGCTPAQVIDCLAIMGDSSDTVPGVKGIGEKGAAKLIQQFGSLEAIYTNTQPLVITAKMWAKLQADREMAFLSKSLVTIKCDVPLSFTLDQCARRTDKKELYSIYEELEFKSLIPNAIDTSIAELYRDGEFHPVG